MNLLVTILQTGAVALAVFGGAFLGHSAYGGYVWHAKAVFALLVAVTVIALLVSTQIRGHFPTHGASLIGIVVGSYFIAEAAGAAFYPATPESWPEFWQSFVRTLKSGPC